MTATCALCGRSINADKAVPLINAGPAAQGNPAMLEAIRRISEFDLLAGRMAQHLTEAHYAQSLEMGSVSFLAAKVYAMTWAEADDALRVAWRKGILEMLAQQSQAVVDQPLAEGPGAAAPAGGGGNSSGAPPSGS